MMTQVTAFYSQEKKGLSKNASFSFLTMINELLEKKNVDQFLKNLRLKIGIRLHHTHIIGMVEIIRSRNLVVCSCSRNMTNILKKNNLLVARLVELIFSLVSFFFVQHNQTISLLIVRVYVCVLLFVLIGIACGVHSWKNIDLLYFTIVRAHLNQTISTFQYINGQFVLILFLNSFSALSHVRIV